MSVSASSHLSAQATAWLDLFLDVVHGDVVLGDQCCRIVGDTMVSMYEPTLRCLSASGALPASLEQALDTYCIRHVLLSAPELMLRSHEVADALLQLAQRLCDLPQTTPGTGDKAMDESAPLHSASAVDTSLPALGHALEKHITSLRKRLTTEEYACCMTVLGDVVSGYVERAAEELDGEAQAQLEPGAPWTGVPSPATAAYRRGVRRFADSVQHAREVRKRAREEAVAHMAEELLFPSLSQTQTQAQTDNTNGKGPVDASTVSTMATFASEVHAAMQSSAPHQGAAPPTHTTQGLVTPPNVARRRVHELDSSVQRGVAALESSVTPPLAQPSQPSAGHEASVVIVDITSSPSSTQEEDLPGQRRGGVQVAGTGSSILNLLDEVEEMSVRSSESSQITAMKALLAAQGFSPDVVGCVTKSEPEARTYFLCAKTGRYEPLAAKGFVE